MARMYETYVPIPEPIEERKPPTIADIVRQKTDGGAMIIDFFTDVMTGRVDDAKLCHRIDAAKQLIKYGHKGAADFIADHGDEPCDHCESRKRGPRSPKGTYQTPGVLHAQAITYDFLNLLTEEPSPTQGDGGADGAEPKIVRPEPVEGQCSAETIGPAKGQRSANPANTKPTTTVVPAQAGFLPQEPSPTQRGGEARADAQLETNNSKPETLPTPGRSPPR